MAKRITQLTALAVPEANDYLPIVDTSSGQTKKTLLAAILGAVYPVGSVYTNAGVSTSPETLLGFGTWERFANGKVLVGVSETETEFDTLGETGGAKTQALTMAQLPKHGLSMTLHGQENGTIVFSQGVTGGTTTGTSIARHVPGSSSAGSNSRQTPGWSFGNDEAHNNLQPYITVYMWKRTA